MQCMCEGCRGWNELGNLRDSWLRIKVIVYRSSGELFLKFMFSKKATKIYEIFIVDLTLCSKCQIDGEDFVNFCGLLRKHEL